MLGVPDQNVLDEVNQVYVVLHFLAVLRGQDFLGLRCYQHEEVNPVVTVEQKLASHYFIEQAPQGPDIGSLSGADFLPPVVVVRLLLIFQSQCEHLGGLNTLGAPGFEIEFILLVLVDLGNSEVSEDDIDLRGQPGVVGRDKLQQDIVTLDVVVGNTLLMQQLHALDHLVEQGQDVGQARRKQFGLRRLHVAQPPVPQRAGVLLHDYHIGVVVNPVVVHTSDPFLQPEHLEAGDLGEDVVEHASLVYALGEVHLLDGHLFGFGEVGFGTHDHSEGSCVDFGPVVVVA